MTKILVLGASGPTGQKVVAQALQRGHEVTALVRSPGRLTLTHDRLRLVTGTLPDESRALGEAMRGQAAVISALGMGKSLQPNGLIARSMPMIVQAMEAAGEEILRRSSLDWTLVYPVTLTSGPKTGRYRAGERLSLHGLPTVSRADVADFLLGQLDEATCIRKGVLIST